MTSKSKRNHICNVFSLKPELHLPLFWESYNELNINEGDTLDSGVFKVTSDRKYQPEIAGAHGLDIASEATVIIYIAKDVTLTCLGRAGNRTINGGAGISLPASSTLIICGQGRLVASGGDIEYLVADNDELWDDFSLPGAGIGGPGGPGANPGGVQGAGTNGRYMGTLYLLDSVVIVATAGNCPDGGRTVN
ncbi:hypothetical protein C4J81_17570 [Deltaproteobacteria bacterium Smac51]|nr:hypothetical protein C4J81_17570 [Deltaproteobacteria bacterium Smac51]